MNKPFRISPVYDRLLRGSVDLPIGLYQLQLAKAEQLTRLHYSPESIKWVQKHLKQLVDNGYIQADCVPTKFFKSPYYYTLGNRGMQYLAHAGLDVNDAFRANKEIDKHALFVEHTLEINDLLIAAALLKRADSRYYLHSFIHERVLKRTPYKTKGFTIIPDGFLDFRLLLPDGKQRRMPLLLEHDRGSEEQHHFRRRIRGYITLLSSGAYVELFQSRAITIAFTTFVGSKRLEQMREWTRQELAVNHEPSSVGSVFLFATFDRLIEPNIWLRQCWFAPEPGQQPITLLSD